MKNPILHPPRPVCKHMMKACFKTTVDFNSSQITENKQGLRSDSTKATLATRLCEISKTG